MGLKEEGKKTREKNRAKGYKLWPGKMRLSKELIIAWKQVKRLADQVFSGGWRVEQTHLNWVQSITLKLPSCLFAVAPRPPTLPPIPGPVLAGGGCSLCKRLSACG